MDPSFATPWDSFVLTLPKFNVIGIEGVYVNNEDEVVDSHEQGGQKGGKTIDTILQLIRDNPNITRKILVEIIGISPILKLDFGLDIF